ncbi:MAG: proton-conducting transporter membrane subunit [Eubacteriales bacterium]|nr:proton-conducting transporter membrane subunit [Eubacteriales bacterium]
MEFVKNVPFFSIMLCMISGVTASMLPPKIAKWWTVALAAVVAALNAWLLSYLLSVGESYTYMMGHFPAPWGNELRGGILEALLAVVFSIVLLVSTLGGMQKLEYQVDPHKQNLFCVMLDLVLAAMISMLYTNDLFTGYVFIEIMTLGACVLIMSRQNGRTLVSAMRYMIMSLLGSGLILIAITLTYNLTGHLLMENIQQSFAQLHASGQYEVPITVITGLFFVGLGIKSALFPFHTWLPDAYGYSTPAASSVLSSIVSKAYIFLLMKIFYRVIGMDIIHSSHVMNLLFIFGVAGMILGSLSAIRSHDLRRMNAYSSVAQIGYLYAGIGLGIEAGFVAAIYHMIMHSVAKSSLFIATSGLADASGDSKRFSDLRGAGYRYPAAGICFSVSAMSLVGIPILGGFVSKLYFSQAAFEYGGVHLWVMLSALALSTFLNVLYFMRTVITLYRPPKKGFQPPAFRKDPRTVTALWIMTALNFLVGLLAQPIVMAITRGLRMFA